MSKTRIVEVEIIEPGHNSPIRTGSAPAIPYNEYIADRKLKRQIKQVFVVVCIIIGLLLGVMIGHMMFPTILAMMLIYAIVGAGFGFFFSMRILGIGAF